MPTIVSSDFRRSEGRETRYVRFGIYNIIVIHIYCYCTNNGVLLLYYALLRVWSATVFVRRLGGIFKRSGDGFLVTTLITCTAATEVDYNIIIGHLM